MRTVYPTLVGEIAKRGIKKSAIAQRLNISERTFYNKLYGIADFTWPEICTINECFFPDLDKDTLFARDDNLNAG